MRGERSANLAGVGGVHHLMLQGTAEHRVVPDNPSVSQLLYRGSLLQQLGQVDASSPLRPDTIRQYNTTLAHVLPVCGNLVLT